MSEQLLIAEEVAEMLRIPITQVYRLARQKQLPSVRVGRYVRFTADGINAYVKQISSLV